MNKTAETVEAIIAHCRALPNANALVVSSSQHNAQDIVERLRQRFFEIVWCEATGNWIGTVDNFYDGKGHVTIRVLE